MGPHRRPGPTTDRFPSRFAVPADATSPRTASRAADPGSPAALLSLAAHDPARLSGAGVTGLQRAVGNQAVAGLLALQRDDAAKERREAARAAREAARAKAAAEAAAKAARAKAFRDTIAQEMAGATGGPYQDWDAFKKTMASTVFLGHTVANGVRKEFADKLKDAEKRINDEFARSGNPIPARYGISGIGGFREEVSQHGWGLAIDIDAGDNPYVMHQAGNAAVDKEVGPVYTRIAEFILNDPIDGQQSVIPKLITTGKNLPATSTATRAERLGQYWDRLHRESEAMTKYFSLMRDTTALNAFLANEWRRTRPNAVPPAANDVVKQMWQDYAALGGAIPKGGPPGIPGFKSPAALNRPFHPIGQAQKDPGAGFLTVPREVVVGLGQAVGRWGAIDFGAESGDVMHFDDRYGLGVPFDAAKDAAVAKARAAAAKKAEDEAKASGMAGAAPATQRAVARQRAPDDRRAGEA